MNFTNQIIFKAESKSEGDSKNFMLFYNTPTILLPAKLKIRSMNAACLVLKYVLQRKDYYIEMFLDWDISAREILRDFFKPKLTQISAY